uniref:uncharacterized protein LOC122579184 isoform X2 n=1 Tax=Erigeron canadensis TaxID=72917 RepID=UPI001CB95E85|nr:uncharacterized protein LOC122579184 isoform X2 [Erigeron canadensis]
MDTRTTTVSPNLFLLNSQQPDFLKSINELSDVSTALSAFLHDFHDLCNHIASISSAIDAQLPPHLLLLLNTTTATLTEAIFEERNSNGTEISNGVLILANNDDDDLMKEKESEQDIDAIWNMIEDIDCHNNNAPLNKCKEADIINKRNVLLKKDPQKIDSFRKPEEIVKLKEDAATDVAQKKKKKRKHEETHVSKADEEIDMSKESHEITISKKKPPDASKKLVENDILVLIKPEQMDVPKEPQEETDVLKKPVEVDILNKPKHIGVSKKPLQEADASKKEIDVMKKADEIDSSKKPSIAELQFCCRSTIKNHAAMMQELSDLKSIRRCLETHKVDPSKFLSGIKVNEKIERLEKVIKELDIKLAEQKSTLKRIEKENEFSKLNKPEEIDVSKKPDEFDVSNKLQETDASNKAHIIDASKKPAIAVLEFLCKYRHGNKVRNHVVAHFSELNSLHQEIAMALKLARHPAMLVLDCICRFFLPTSRGCYHGEFMHQERSAKLSKGKGKHIVVRQASVLLLESFVMISGDGIEIRKQDKEYAENAAIDWRKRIINEGGLIYMEAVDARGLLLFISGFGIPDGVFSNEDFSDLIRASNVKEISNALCHSTILISKLPEVIDWMVKNNLEIEAADIAYTFGLEDKCHPETILMTFLHNKIKHTQNGSSLQVNATMMQQLSDLKSIRSCLETHKIDPSKFLPGVKINEKIEQLEKVLNELDSKSNEEKSTLKRKKKETESSKSNKPEKVHVSKQPDEMDVSNKPEKDNVLHKPKEIDVSKKAEEIDPLKKPAIAELEFWCKRMDAKKIKKHVVAHISEMNSLHQEIAKALKLARNPARLVLHSIGRYFLQSSGAYYSRNGHQQIAIRQSSVLILECFVIISGDGIKITKEDEEYANNVAIDWRKRMLKEGGLICMEAVDARGLLLFISGFGIPNGVFSIEDFSDLIRASKVKEISNALRHSTILISKLPEVIDWMVKNNLEIEAADIAYTFGLEDKCHPETILMTFLQNRNIETQNGSSLQVLEIKFLLTQHIQ